MAGTLYIVATPIGNLEDLSPRAQRVLREVELIVAEDTRHSGVLLRHFGIENRLISMHEHNESERVDGLVQRLLGGESIAQISDAGTPLINDPGFRLAAMARRSGVTVTAVPGASAPIVALTLSGLAVNRFSFEGFVPAREGARRQFIESLKTEQRTMIFFESPRRVVETLQLMERVFGGERQVAVARELTKIHESIHTAPLATLVPWMMEEKDRQRGEFVLVVEGAQQPPPDDLEALRVVRLLSCELPPRKAATIAAEITGMKKNRLYQMLLGAE